MILAAVLLKMGTYGFIRFSLPVAARARLDIYNVLGRRVRRLVDDERGLAGGARRGHGDGGDGEDG